ncbi:FAD-binding oxidoreductase [Pseudogemmobacter sp. W21_MBD1_M6]|uniref:FAD-binding oxidoreductase n=1 Tax=Pseudogemmobacter sp. W21_MBD1_M6 TaxID=3240271 RepID=UPI003F9C34C1
MLNPVTPAFETHLRSLLPADAFREVTPKYLEEPRGRYAGTTALLVAPANAQDVATVVRACNDARVGIVPYAGGTGLVGGQIFPGGPTPVILTVERMTAIRDIYPNENVLVAEAGAILQDIQSAAIGVDRLFPLSLASEGSCRIGGNLATNAGGVNVLRYGNTRDLCLGLEVVLPDGQIWNGLSRLRKNNTGYDLRHLMIGAEGTLGIITAASLKLFPQPVGTGAAMLIVPDPEAALELLALARDRMGDSVSAFEIIHRQSMEFLAEVMPEVRLPFQTPPEWTVLIDVGLPMGLEVSDALEQLFIEAHARGLVSDGVISQSGAQRQSFWQVRESIPEANRRIGSVSSQDIALPMGRIAEFIIRAGQALAQIGTFRINCFGHLGDGNLHYNVFPVKGKHRSDYDAIRPKVKEVLHDLVDAMDGSVSAEHGIGRLKVADLEKYGDPAKLATMRAIKTALDPNGIMNPGAVLRD